MCLNFAISQTHKIHESLVLVVILFFQVEEQWFPVMAGGIAQEERTHRLSDCAPLNWATSVVCRPEAFVAPGIIFSQSILSLWGSCISYQLLAELSLWADGASIHYNSHLSSQGKMTSWGWGWSLAQAHSAVAAGPSLLRESALGPCFQESLDQNQRGGGWGFAFEKCFIFLKSRLLFVLKT